MALRMLLAALFLGGFIIWRGVLPARLNRWWKITLSAAVLISVCKFNILHLWAGGKFFAPELPAAFLLFSSWLYAIVFIYFFLLLAAELIRTFRDFIIKLCRRKKTDCAKLSLWNNRVNLALLIISLLLSTAGIFSGTAIPQVKQIKLTLHGMPENSRPLRAVLLADLHADRITDKKRIAEIVGRVNEVQPDLVFIAGDFVDGPVKKYGDALLPLKELKSRCGVFGVPGNHEYYSGFHEWMEFLSALNVKMLLNNSTVIENSGIAVAGVTDPAALFTAAGAPPDIEKALSGIPPGMPVILLSHRPDFAQTAAACGVVLQLSGHTHGGLMRIFDLLVAAFNKGYVSGSYNVGNMILYVSNGSGIWNGFPIRLGRSAEITVLELTGK